jgi:hypothetical protein
MNKHIVNNHGNSCICSCIKLKIYSLFSEKKVIPNQDIPNIAITACIPDLNIFPLTISGGFNLHIIIIIDDTDSIII